VAIVKRLEEKDITVDSHITIVRSNPDRIDKYFFGATLLEKQSEIEKFALGSTGQVELSRFQLEGIKLILPPLSLQNSFNAVFGPTLDKMAICEMENQHLSSLRDWLLPMLMNGQVTVGGKGKSLYEGQEELRMAAESEE
jgi:type I restriction enzyme S subunit